MLIIVSDGICSHNGTVCGGSVSGTITVGSNNFVSIENKKIMEEDGTLEIPIHNNPPCIPPNMQSHSFQVNNFQQNYVFINGKRIILLNDSYTGDLTTIINQGSNNFVSIS